MLDHPKSRPLIALVSMTTRTSVDLNNDQVESTSSPQLKLKPYSDLLWTLRRLGVSNVIAHPYELNVLCSALENLERPPPIPQYKTSLLQGLHEERRNQFLRDPIQGALWTQNMNLLPIPKKPFSFDQIKLCFHDELIGSPDAFLIHYGESHHQVTGYHHPISAISVPVSPEISAVLISQLPYQDKNENAGEIETCVMHLSAQGELLNGPWWPRRHHL